jgi:hypothetical protein
VAAGFNNFKDHPEPKRIVNRGVLLLDLKKLPVVFRNWKVLGRRDKYWLFPHVDSVKLRPHFPGSIIPRKVVRPEVKVDANGIIPGFKIFCVSHPLVHDSKLTLSV